MRDGRMFMTLRNADPDKVFSGVARISLTEDQRQQDVTPLNVTLLPDKEVAFPLDDATLTNGDWILMVYDLNGAARLIRGASLAPPKAPAQAPGASNIAEATVPGRRSRRLTSPAFTTPPTGRSRRSRRKSRILKGKTLRSPPPPRLRRTAPQTIPPARRTRRLK